MLWACPTELVPRQDSLSPKHKKSTEKLMLVVEKKLQYMTLGGTIAQKFQVDSLVMVVKGAGEGGTEVRGCLGSVICAGRWHLFSAVAHIPLLPFIACRWLAFGRSVGFQL